MATWLLSPLAWLLLATVLIAAAGLARRHRGWMVVSGLGLGTLALMAMTPMGANALLRPLERPVPMPDACAQLPPVAIVLGGGLEGWPGDDGDFLALNLASRRRMDRAAAWWHQDESRTLVLQGGAPYPGGVPIARLMASYAIALGVPDSQLRIEDQSGDTWQNAERAARLSPKLPRRVVLVTSRVHMPRAREAFASAGFEVCPEGAESRRLPSRLPWALFPRTSALVTSDMAIHEWVGLAYYRWRARHPVPDS